MRHTFAVALLFVASQLLFAIPANLVPYFHSPRPDIFTAGQPTEEGFKLLASMGLKTVINVLPEKYCVREEPDVVIRYGMTYRSIPFQTATFRKATVERFAYVLETAKKPVLIHCSTGNHAAAVWFSYRMLYEDASLDQALVEARLIGLRPQLEETLIGSVLAARRDQ